jgi:diguanylate cyclase (GGDEF)-like protein
VDKEEPMTTTAMKRTASDGMPDLAATIRRLAAGLKEAALPHHDETAERALRAVADVERRLAEQERRIADLERLAVTDELTGLLNRRGFKEALQHALAAASRYGEEGVLVYIDLDGFKPINDTYGHDAGDEVLRQVARLLRDNVRDTDYVARLGGDEFAVLLTRTLWGDGLTRAEKLERVIEATYVSWDGRLIGLAASFGVQAYGASDRGVEILRRADDAMYDRKRRRAGRIPRIAVA